MCINLISVTRFVWTTFVYLVLCCVYMYRIISNCYWSHINTWSRLVARIALYVIVRSHWEVRLHKILVSNFSLECAKMWGHMLVRVVMEYARVCLPERQTAWKKACVYSVKIVLLSVHNYLDSFEQRDGGGAVLNWTLQDTGEWTSYCCMLW